MAEKVERKLAAFLSADVMGSSRLMVAGEEGTISRLKARGGPKMKRAIATGIAVALLLLTGSATRAQEPALATNVEDLGGIWHTVISATPKKHFYQFKEYGTYMIARASEDLEDRSEHVGEFWFEGTQLFIKRR